MPTEPNSALATFAHPCTQRWFETSFEGETAAQSKGWPSIARGESTLLLAPTGSGKTLAAFLVAIDRLLFGNRPELAPASKKPKGRGKSKAPQSFVRVLYVSPLKALAVDVERNLRAPLAGIRARAERDGTPAHPVSVGIRSGDTPPRERARMKRYPPDVLITTPESLYLLLTSDAAQTLTEVETVIIDEIHSVVPTKRGSHLALTLERLQAIRKEGLPPLQRIGLSATQRPLDEVGRFLGGFEEGRARPITIVDAGSKKKFELVVEVPVEDMARLDAPATENEAEDPLEWEVTSGPTSGGSRPTSIWPAIHPRLVKLIRDHRSTMIFVNSRRLAERLAASINELAEEELALAHHGSIAKDIRANIEDRLKRGLLPAIVATSSLELGIDIGAVDLVIQIEAPLSVASGVQRIGRAGHQVGAVSRGIVFPKYRGDLLACATVTEHIHRGLVEATHYPRNTLDVLAQHIVAIVSRRLAIDVEVLFDLVCGAAPFAELPRRSFDGVLDMLSGRYPSEQFGELRPRITWDRITGQLTPRRGAKMLAIANAGTIPDRGLYGVFLADADKPVRVGELDEEMVFESREGEIFLLGASSWRIQEITHDRVLVTPAPGEPGRMPFWHGDRPGRPAEFGRAIGKLARELLKAPQAKAQLRLVDQHGLDERAADNLLRYLYDQKEATGQVPSDQTVVIERFTDEIGDWCVTVLTPFGSRVHAPWATAVKATLMAERGIEADLVYADDGMVFRLPESDQPPPDELFFPDPADVERILTAGLSETALFAARFRENAGRALLLPRRRPGQRTPLWAQRRKSANLLGVASGFPDFPILLETYRECLRDVFDLPELTRVLSDIRSRKIRVASVETRTPSPFASAIMFHYVATFMYEGDAPLAERRAQALSLDHAQLRQLLGEPELRELLDADAVRAVEEQVQRLKHPIRHIDAVHDLLLSLGDLSEDEIEARTEVERRGEALDQWVPELVRARRIVPCEIAGEKRFIALEDVARYRDALGLIPPTWTPSTLLEPVRDPLGDLVGRYARVHGPFRSEQLAARLGLGVQPVQTALHRLEASGRVVIGELLPLAILKERELGPGVEFCDAEVLKRIKRKSLAHLREQVEPVDEAAFGRFLLEWQNVGTWGTSGADGKRRGADALVAVVEQLQGATIPVSDLERSVLPARVGGFDPRDLDELLASGELVWRGVQSLGDKDGRVALFLAEHYALLASPSDDIDDPLQLALLDEFDRRGAMFFRDLVSATQRLPSEVFEALWALVWAGQLTNDTLAPMRRLGAGRGSKSRGRPSRLGRLATRAGPPGSEGRWSRLPLVQGYTPTQRLEALATSLLERQGVLTREAAGKLVHGGGFGAVYPVLKAMEEVGRVRRGYFVAGRGATQFALPGCEQRLRDQRDPGDESLTHVLAADDPANPYGVALPWPAPAPDAPVTARPARAAGAQVILVDGALAAYLGRTGERLDTFLPEREPERARVAMAVARAVMKGHGRPRGKRGGGGVLLKRIDGLPAQDAPFARVLLDVGFQPSGKGLFRRYGESPLRPSLLS